MDAIPSSRLISAKVTLEDPKKGPDGQIWAIGAIDANPDIAKFGKRVANLKGAFAKKLVSAIIDSAI